MVHNSKDHDGPAPSSETGRLRLDEALVARGEYPSRARARDAVKRGAVRVDGGTETRPSRPVSHDSNIEIDDVAQAYVSRAAVKLAHALEQFQIDVSGRRGLDIGVSTGGFTQVLLQRGAAHVTAVDVGHGQLAAEVAADSRVTSIEGLNARDLSPADINGPVDIIVCDVSFISLMLALPPALALAAPGAWLVALIKPQFEAGRAALGKGGIVRDAAVHRSVCDDIGAFLQRSGWKVKGLTASPIVGGDGNAEFLIAARKTGPDQ